MSETTLMNTVSIEGLYNSQIRNMWVFTAAAFLILNSLKGELFYKGGQSYKYLYVLVSLCALIVVGISISWGVLASNQYEERLKLEADGNQELIDKMYAWRIMPIIYVIIFSMLALFIVYNRLVKDIVI